MMLTGLADMKHPYFPEIASDPEQYIVFIDKLVKDVSLIVSNTGIIRCEVVKSCMHALTLLTWVV